MKDLAQNSQVVAVESILEVGCGDGKFLRQLMASSPDATRIVGVDIVDPRTTLPQDLLAHPRCEWVTAYGHDLPFPDDSFDLVSIAHVLHHLQPDLQHPTLSEMLRVLKPGGEFMICEMFCDNLTDPQMSHVFYHHWIADIDRLCGVHHYETFLRSELMEIVESIGFSECEIEELNEEMNAEEEQQAIAKILLKIETELERVKENEEFERLKQEAQSIQVWILTHGLAKPTRLLVSGRMGGLRVGF